MSYNHNLPPYREFLLSEDYLHEAEIIDAKKQKCGVFYVIHLIMECFNCRGERVSIKHPMKIVPKYPEKFKHFNAEKLIGLKVLIKVFNEVRDNKPVTKVVRILEDKNRMENVS